MEREKISVITNFILVFIITLVGITMFVPHKVVPMYNGNQVVAIYKGNTDNKNISLMFNVYENTEVVNKIVELLNERQAKATFFVGGCWADDNQKSLKKIKDGGHEIANHGYFHKDHKKLNYEENKAEISLTGKITEVLAQVKPTLFAPPSGSYSNLTLEVCDELGYKVIMWSKDTIDWRDSDEKKIFSRATKNISNGDLVLMHPKEHTLKALPHILDYYESVGYNIVTVSDNLK